MYKNLDAWGDPKCKYYFDLTKTSNEKFVSPFSLCIPLQQTTDFQNLFIPFHTLPLHSYSRMYIKMFFWEIDPLWTKLGPNLT